MFSKKEKQIIAYTVEKCPTCNKESKRKFKQGDILFAESSQCDKCKIPTAIAKIFGEPIE
jgi:ssDNA-binding Zn-finger/Zn-ribbon topoisomerase 1